MIGERAFESERKLLGSNARLRGPMPIVIAVMMFVMVVIAAAGIALANGARLTASTLENRYSVQAPGAAEKAADMLAAVGGLEGVERANAVDKDEMRETLARWLGPSGDDANLPLPLLVELDLSERADRTAIEQAAKRVVADARLVSHQGSLEPVTTTFRTLGWLALALVLLIALAAAAAVVLATRGALDTHRSTIEVMHGVGATDRQIARLFQRKMALDALVGGAVGAIFAGAALLFLAGGASPFIADLASGPLIRTGDILLLAALPLAGTLIAALAARHAVLAKLEAMP